MASITGTFVADGESAVLSGAVGNVDISVKLVPGSTGHIYLQESLDSGTTWFATEGGHIGPHGGDRVLIAGSGSIQYKLVARGVNGSIMYVLGVA